MDKTAINIRMQSRYDELMRIGKNGHYETMFQVFHEELARQKADSQAVLRDALEVIKGWHNMGGGADVWQIYYDNAPEMQSIRAALGKASTVALNE